eukprot:CAMPEP_0185027848 /NCGR_PEP_ID=MMETSP1103-20130426/13112_1 /TAXON_ID=36769 /ORGANISM="Paraphysomonas bandaiensis, Strain Caron Lab Isolate" /LENGTH=107 /DNA_ID=CAMNT_0027561999 /DNA_START=185 /DNA_END=505 /DNA_ORIENTATION=-
MTSCFWGNGRNSDPSWIPTSQNRQAGHYSAQSVRYDEDDMSMEMDVQSQAQPVNHFCGNFIGSSQISPDTSFDSGCVFVPSSSKRRELECVDEGSKSKRQRTMHENW